MIVVVAALRPVRRMRAVAQLLAYARRRGDAFGEVLKREALHPHHDGKPENEGLLPRSAGMERANGLHPCVRKWEETA